MEEIVDFILRFQKEFSKSHPTAPKDTVVLIPCFILGMDLYVCAFTYFNNQWNFKYATPIKKMVRDSFGRPIPFSL